MRREIQTLFVSTLAAISLSVAAQTTTTPAVPNTSPGTNAGSPYTGAYPSTPGTTAPNSPASSTMGQGASGTSRTPATAAGTPSSRSANARMTDADIRQYVQARKDCSHMQSATQSSACENDVNSRFSAVDPKCQKLSDAALEECLRGADRGK